MDSSAPEAGNEVMRVTWERGGMVALCRALGVDYVEFGVCREIQVQMCNKLISSETNLVGKTESGHFKANKIRFSPSVFIILFIYFCLS